MRRDVNDSRWQRVKEGIGKRDKGMCRLLRVLTHTEALMLKKKAGPMFNVLDPAHYLPVSKRPDLVYLPQNIVLLNRFSHDCLDNFRDPISGVHIAADKVNEWWIRILEGNPDQIEVLRREGLLEGE